MTRCWLRCAKQVSTRPLDDVEEDPVRYRHRPFGQRMARPRTRVPGSRFVGGLAMALVAAAVVLWIWALVRALG